MFDEALTDLERTRKGRAIVSQTNVGNDSKATLGKTSERQSGAHMGFSQRIDSILKRSEELN